MMTENPVIIRMNIAHYRALLKLDMDDLRRRTIERLLAEANGDLVLAREQAEASPPGGAPK